MNAIKWLSAGEDTLTIGTEGGEWTPNVDGILSATNTGFRRQTTRGSADIRPVRVGGAVLFVQRGKRKLREFARSGDVNNLYNAIDITRLAQHVTRSGLVELAYAEEPDSIVFSPRVDGQLAALTYQREEDVVGWGRHILGGEFLDDNTAITRVWQVDDSADTFVDETADANDTGDADWTLFPSSEAVDDYAAFGYTKPFTQLKFDYANGTAGVGGTVTWEYWNGSTWVALSGVTDGTNAFTATAADGLTVTWTEPTNWATRILSTGKKLYYIRARITTVYTTNPILDQGYVQDVGAAVVESVAVIPGDNGTGQIQDTSERDEIWLVVKRTINGATKRYIEFYERDYEEGQEQADAYYSDSIITYDGVPTTTITGLGHLEGQTVKVFGDGAIIGEKTVSSAQITLDDSVSKAQIGIGYTHRLKTLKIKSGNPAGTPVGKTKRLYGMTVVLLNSLRMKYGPTTSNLKDKDFRLVSDPMDIAAPLFTGEAYVDFHGDWGTDPRIVIEDDAPAPFTILAIAPETGVNPLI